MSIPTCRRSMGLAGACTAPSADAAARPPVRRGPAVPRPASFPRTLAGSAERRDRGSQSTSGGRALLRAPAGGWRTSASGVVRGRSPGRNGTTAHPARRHRGLGQAPDHVPAAFGFLSDREVDHRRVTASRPAALGRVAVTRTSRPKTWRPAPRPIVRELRPAPTARRGACHPWHGSASAPPGAGVSRPGFGRPT